MVLHHRDVLVGRGVEDHDAAVLVEDAVHAVQRRDVGEASRRARPARARHASGPRVAPAEEGEFAIDVVERAFGAVEQDQPRRVEVEHLARQLRADRAARARDEDRPAGEEVTEAALVHDDRVAAEEVGDLDLADRCGTKPAGNEFVERGHRACLETEPCGVLDGASHDLARRRWDRDEQPSGAGDAGDVGELAQAAEDLAAPQHLVPLGASSSRRPTTRIPSPSLAAPIVRRTVAPTSPAP